MKVIGYFVDTEMMVGPSGYFPKEITLIEVYECTERYEHVYDGGHINYMLHELVEPPYDWNELTAKQRATNAWIMRNRLRLSYAYYTICQDHLKREFLSCVKPGSMVFTKGEEKARMLSKFFDHPVDSLEAAPRTAECDNDSSCKFNHGGKHCSRRKARFYAEWMKQNSCQVVRGVANDEDQPR